MENVAETPSTLPVGAGIGIRILARLIDIVVINLVVLVISFPLLIIVGILISATGGDLADVRIATSDLTWLYAFFGFLIVVAYGGICEGLHGSTPGKLICGLRVLKEDGSPSTFKAGIVRTLGLLVDGLFLGIVGIMIMQRTPKRQRRGDHWADTIVVRVNEYPDLAEPSQPFWRAFALALIASSVIAAIGALYMVFP